MSASTLEKNVERLCNEMADMKRQFEEPHVSTHGDAASFFRTPMEDDLIQGRHLKGGKVWQRGRGIPREYKRQFKSLTEFLRKGMSENPTEQEDFQSKHRKSLDSLKKSFGMNTYEGSSGGSLVLPEFAPEIFEREWSNDLFDRTDNYTVSGNRMTFPKLKGSSRADGDRHGGVQAYWRGEEDAATTSNPKLEDMSLRLNDLCIAVYVTEEMLEDDSYALQQRVSRVVRREINFKLGAAVTEGTGVGQPLGYLNAPGTVTVDKEGSQSATTLTGQNILDMWARRLSVGGTDNLIWTINQDVEPQLHQMSLGSGEAAQIVYTPPGGLSSTPYATVMGRPVIPTEYNETLGTRGDIGLCDFSQMVSISKGGINEAVSMHVEFLRKLRCFLFSIRVDARPFDDRPITPYKGTNTQSPFVVLETRS